MNWWRILMNSNMTDEIMKTRHYVTINLIDCHLMLIFKIIEAPNVETTAMFRLSINTISIILDRKNLMFIDHFQIIFNFNFVIYRIMLIKITSILSNNDLFINQIKTIRIILTIKIKTALISRLKVKIMIKISKVSSINI